MADFAAKGHFLFLLSVFSHQCGSFCPLTESSLKLFMILRHIYNILFGPLPVLKCAILNLGNDEAPVYCSQTTQHIA